MITLLILYLIKSSGLPIRRLLVTMLAFITLSFILPTTAQASKYNFAFLPTVNNQDQSRIHQLLQQNNYNQVIQLWQQAYGNQAFTHTATGKSFQLWLLAQTASPQTALDYLVTHFQPQSLDARMANLWQQLFNEKRLKLSSNSVKAWTKVFNSTQYEITAPSSYTELRKLQKDYLRANEQGLNPNSEALWLWTIATSAPQFNELRLALNAIYKLKQLKQTQIGIDILALNEARVLYQLGKLDDAINLYNTISKGSDYWLEAMEEKSWALTRQKKYASAKSSLLTLQADLFAPWLGPEPYFLSNYINLQICDYVSIFKTSEAFKTRFSSRIKALQDLADTGKHSSLDETFSILEAQGPNTNILGKLNDLLPRNFLRNQLILSLLAHRQIVQREQKALEILKSQTQQTSQLSATMQQLLFALERQNNKTLKLEKQNFSRELRQLARADLIEFKTIIQKMNVVEAEVIQRMYTEDGANGLRGPLPRLSQQKNTLSFPYSDELWLDEIDHLQARVKSCPSIKEASL